MAFPLFPVDRRAGILRRPGTPHVLHVRREGDAGVDDQGGGREPASLARLASARLCPACILSPPPLAMKAFFFVAVLHSFFQAGMTAPQAASVIHSDFEKGFIRCALPSRARATTFPPPDLPPRLTSRPRPTSA